MTHNQRFKFVCLLFLVPTLLLWSTSCSHRPWSSSGSSQTDTNSAPADAKSLDQEKVNAIVREQKKLQAQNDFPVRGFDYSQTLEKIVFASCLDQTKPAPILKSILNEKPDFLLMLGDNIYAATADKKPISDQYIKLNQNSDWLTLRKNIPTMAIWDDHDFGVDDGDKNNPEKEIARSEFLKHFHYIKSSFDDRKQTAIYHAKTIGPIGKQVQFIMLDLRYDRDALESQQFENYKKPLKIPTTDKNLKLMSEAQWRWLEKKLQEPAQLRFLVSPIQFLAEDHIFERWSLFPHEKARMIQILKKLKAKNLFILSGDRHLAAFAKETISGYGDLYDFTSSSINLPKNGVGEDSKYLMPIYNQENYGMIEINWQKRNLTFAIKNLNAETPLKTEVKF